ncbi:hypothetical protein scyTo_0020121, partial [Scyliorhinus torazame]|nr:hypothetical protein [Scyliorhinus torazame]
VLKLNHLEQKTEANSEEYKMQQPKRSLCVRLCVGLIGLIVFISMELPVESFDPAGIDLTELVNRMINRTLEGNQQFFSLLSVTSHSSFALHKVSILIYNISSFWNIDPSIFPMKYCYCLNNRTNDLTDFTAVVVDFVGNTTSYFKEIFKSSSILYGLVFLLIIDILKILNRSLSYYLNITLHTTCIWGRCQPYWKWGISQRL